MEAWRRLLFWARRRRLEEELAEELRFHAEMKAAAYQTDGLAAEEAGRHARRALGNERRIREASRQFWGWPWFESVAGDAAYALRQMRRNPGVAAVAIVSLCLGITANTTVFSLIDAMWWRRLPVPAPEHLVRIAPERRNGTLDRLSWPEVEALRMPLHTLSGVAAHYSFAPLQVEADHAHQELSGAVVSASYFSVLDLQPERGRFFTAAEDAAPDRDAVAVVSRHFARTLGGGAAALGREIRINGVAFRVIGIMDPRFHGELSGGSEIEVWIPAMMIRTGYRWCDGLQADCPTFELVGRLAEGQSLAAARAEVGARLTTLDEQRHIEPRRAALEPAFGFPRELRSFYTDQMKVLGAVTAVLWLLACANVGGLLIARGEARQHEIAVRRSLGAGGPRLARQMLTEALVLAALATALALAATRWSRQLLVAFYAVDSEGYRTFLDLRMNGHMLILGLGFALGTALLFGLAPALHTARANTLGSGSRSSSSHRLGPILVTLQLALSAALLVAVGLLTQSSLHLAHGGRLDTSGVALSRLRPQLVQRAAASAQAFIHAAVGKIAELPGVESVTLSRGQGLLWKQCCTQRLDLPGLRDARPDEGLAVGDQEIGPGFFRTLGIPLLRGREFGEGDHVGTPPVAIVNETLARRLGGAATILGKALRAGAGSWTIVGVVADAQVTNQRQGPAPFLYLPFWQNPDQVDARLAARTRGDPATLLADIRRAVASIDPEVPVTEQLTLADQLAAASAQARLIASVTLTTGVLALGMSAVGLGGVIAFGVRRRTRELGIRMALGATREKARAAVLREGVWCLAIGLVVGMISALATVRFLEPWLFGVQSRDPLAFGLAALTLVATGSMAAWIPARRITDLDPADALRAD